MSKAEQTPFKALGVKKTNNDVFWDNSQSSEVQTSELFMVEVFTDNKCMR